MAGLSSLAQYLWLRLGAYPRVVQRKGDSVGLSTDLLANFKLGFQS